jgi:hypothetical protein
MRHAWDRRENWFWWESLKERDHLKDEVADGRTRSEWISRRLAGGMEWFQLAQNRDRLRAVVSAVMNLRLLLPRGSFTHTLLVGPKHVLGFESQ